MLCLFGSCRSIESPKCFRSRKLGCLMLLFLMKPASVIYAELQLGILVRNFLWLAIRNKSALRVFFKIKKKYLTLSLDFYLIFHSKKVFLLPPVFSIWQKYGYQTLF